MAQNGVAGILLPSLTAVFGDGNALAFSAVDVWESPVGGQVAHRSVKVDECAILLTLQVVGLAAAGKDAQTVVACVSGSGLRPSTKRLGFAILPASDIGPRDHILGSGVAPRNVAPVDVVRVPLVVKMVCLCVRIVHHAAWVIQPSSRSGEMVAWAPSCEEAVVAQPLDNIFCQHGRQIIGTNDRECGERKAQKGRRAEHAAQ